MTNSSLNLIIPHLWQVRSERLEQLRTRHQLPTCPVSNLTSLTQLTPSDVTPQMPPLTHDLINKDPKVNAQLAQTERVQSTQELTKATTPSASIQAIEYANWQDLHVAIKQCTNCNLCHARQTAVISRGVANAKWMIVGEAPGEAEEQIGEPFAGEAGQLLNKMLGAIGLDCHTQVYITHIIKCKAPLARSLDQAEILACANYLSNQIRMVQPQLIIALGTHAAQLLTNSQQALAKLRNRVHYHSGIPLIVTYPPSFLLQTPTAKKATWEDLQLAQATFKQLNS